ARHGVAPPYYVLGGGQAEYGHGTAGHGRDARGRCPCPAISSRATGDNRIALSVTSGRGVRNDFSGPGEETRRRVADRETIPRDDHPGRASRGDFHPAPFVVAAQDGLAQDGLAVAVLEGREGPGRLPGARLDVVV